MSKKDLKETQVFTPPSVTNQMLDLLDPSSFADHETFFFEPSCGDGEMLVVMVEKIFNELLKKYGDKEMALADALFKFYAIELDDKLVPIARMRIFKWATNKAERELSPLEQYLISRSLQQSIENRDFFEVIKGSLSTPFHRAIERSARSSTKAEPVSHLNKNPKKKRNIRK